MTPAQPDLAARATAGPAEAPSRLVVEVLRREGIWSGGDPEDARLAEALGAAFHAAGASGLCEVAVILAGDGEIRDLNRSWRGKDAATNVLSFPQGDMPAAAGAVRPLGDIVLAEETIAREARERGISITDHALHLAVHGLLHILGHDHDDEIEALRMEQLETEILAGIGIADPHADPEAE